MSRREPVPSSGFVVAANEQLTMHQIGEIDGAGGATMRTAHVGNSGMYNSVVAETGVPLVLHDLTVPARDKNYHPGSQIVNGKSTRIVDKDDMHRLTRHLASTGATGHPTDTGLPEGLWAQAGESVVDIHVRAMRAAHPRTEITTTTDYFLSHDARTMDGLRAIAQHDLGDWRRYVDPEGVVHIKEGSPSELVERYGIFRDGSERGEKQGMLPPVTATIMMLSVNDALDHGTKEVYHLSGPDMIGYVQEPTLLAELQAMYATLKADKSFRGSLPDTLKFHIVPSTPARLAVPASQRHALDTLVVVRNALTEANTALDEATRGREDIETAYKDALRAQDPAATALAATANAKLREARGAARTRLDQLQKAATACASLFVSTDKGRYPTQYDLAADPEGLYVHPLSMTTRLDDLASIVNDLSGYVVRK